MAEGLAARPRAALVNGRVRRARPLADMRDGPLEPGDPVRDQALIDFHADDSPPPPPQEQH